MGTASALSIFIYAAVLFVSIVLARLLIKPLKFLMKLFLNSALGCVAILVINTLFASVNFQIALNAVSAVICAFLGVGGVAFLTLFNLIF